MLCENLRLSQYICWRILGAATKGGDDRPAVCASVEMLRQSREREVFERQGCCVSQGSITHFAAAIAWLAWRVRKMKGKVDQSILALVQ